MAHARNFDLNAKVTFLLNAASYPEPTSGVEGRESHMSWVFLTDRFAYKLKKPVLFSFLDFSSVERRKHFCEEEIRLNRRLAPHVYIGTVPLAVDAHGTLSLGGHGHAIDWLVKMHRLPQERMLDHAIRHASFTREQIEDLGRLLTAFYREAPRIPLTSAEYLRRLEADVTENLRELSGAGSILALETVQRAHASQLDFLHEQSRLAAARADEGRIVEAHGDLRPEHVVLTEVPQVIDRLEFNKTFRTLDPLDELAYFAIECEMLGAGAIGVIVLDRYRIDNADAAAVSLIDFYKCYRACLRAKLAIWHLREPDMHEPEHWRKRARRYLAVAQTYAQRLAPAYLSMSATIESPV